MPSPIRRRRSKTEMENIRAGIYEIAAGGHPMTVRQVFYQLSNRGLIDKTEAEYKQTVMRLMATMRLQGDLPFAWVADNSRWMRKPDTHSSLKNMLDITASAYRRALWDDQDVYVEIWLEKEALSGVGSGSVSPNEQIADTRDQSHKHRDPKRATSEGA